MIVVSDTTPLNYLVLIGAQEVLPALFGQVVIPETVLGELQAAATPEAVRDWIASPPPWLVTRKAAAVPDPSLSHLHEGEREAIHLAEELRADLLLLDERAARKVAASRGLTTSGTLAILDRAAEKGLVDFPQALQQLKQTSFYLSPSVEQFFLERHVRHQTGG